MRRVGGAGAPFDYAFDGPNHVEQELEPTMTADMKLALVLDHTRVSLRAVVFAARDTFDSLSMKHHRTSPRPRPALTSSSFKLVPNPNRKSAWRWSGGSELPTTAYMERAVVRDEEALCECLLLTSTTLVHGIKGLGAAFTAAIAAMRAELGFVPPGQQRIILDQLAETRNDVRPASPWLRETLLHPRGE